ncbi:MAG: RNA methyltransferase [Acidobacteriota bacterium]|nr:RNA methyltransferase [Acidobacteriota bacterium]
MCVIEGPDLVGAALEQRVEFEALYVDVARLDAAMEELVRRAASAGVRTFGLESAVFQHVADTKAPQGVLGAVRLPAVDLASLVTPRTLLVLVDVQDPGNAGTLVRSADASGASAVVFTPHSVDPFNPKTLRATAGSIFHVPIVVAPFDVLEDYCTHHGVQLVASVARGGADPRDANLSRASALLVGNEATGLSPEIERSCDLRVTVPMTGHAESLNAGVAGSLLAFEALYQRRGAGHDVPRSSL